MSLLPTLFAALVTVVVFSILVKLGFWQLDRGHQKRLAEQSLEALSLQPVQPLSLELLALQPAQKERFFGLRVEATLSPTSLPTLLVDNQTLDGKVGYLVVQPMRLDTKQLLREENGTHYSAKAEELPLVLVDLGFVEAELRRDVIPTIQKITQTQSLTTRLYVKSANSLVDDSFAESMTSSNGESVLRVQSLSPESFSALAEKPVWPVIMQANDLDGWQQPMVWQPFPMKAEKHFGYAVQWFAMASVFLGLMVLIAWRWLRRR